MKYGQVSYKELGSQLYNQHETGVVILEDVLPSVLTEGMKLELEENTKNFVKRAVCYGTTLQMLSSWDFERAVLLNYDYLSVLEERYRRISDGLHSYLDYSAQVDEVSVNASLYKTGSLGIGPHIDNTFSVNFIVIFVISGSNSFFTAKDKGGTGEVEHKVKPGDCVVMRGPRGIGDRSWRPIHYVKYVPETRYIVTFREINHEYLRQTGKGRQYNV